MHEEDLKADLKLFQLNYLKFRQKIFAILNIFKCNFDFGAKFPFLQKLINPIIFISFLVTNLLSLFYEFEGEPILNLTMTLVIFAGIFQIFCKIVVIIFSPGNINDLIEWISRVHMDSSWINLGSFVEKRLQTALRYIDIASKYNNFILSEI